MMGGLEVVSPACWVTWLPQRSSEPAGGAERSVLPLVLGRCRGEQGATGC